MNRGKTVKRAFRRGFTLIELLVVIAIIALLISILAPSLGKAREEAKAARCQSSMRQIMVFTLMYKHDEPGEKLLWYRIGQDDPGEAYPGAGIITPWVFAGFIPPLPRTDNADSNLVPVNLRPLNKYAAPLAQGNDRIDLYVDPGDRTWQTAIIGQPGPEVGEEQEFSSWQANGTSYTLNTRFMQGYNWPGGGFGVSPESLDLWSSRIAKSTIGGNGAKNINWLEQGAYSAFYNAGPSLQDTGAGPQRKGWHKRFSAWVAGFADGHAEFRTMDTRVAHDLSGRTIWDPRKPYGGVPPP